MDSKIFKAYDIRGIYPTEIDEEAVYCIAQAYVQKFKPKNMVLGKDVRLSSPSLWQAAAEGFLDLGVDVIDIGTIPTDVLYFVVANYGYDGGFTISASHNPREYNGIKMVTKESKPISADTGLLEIRDIAVDLMKEGKQKTAKRGKIIKKEFLNDYKNHVLSFIDTDVLKPIKVLANANFGAAGRFLLETVKDLPITIIPLNFEPDGSFPKGRPDPLIPENRQETTGLIKKEKSDFGVSWDADADRCFFFDESGDFITGCFITALLAKIFLQKYGPGQKIISDPRLVWAIEDIVEEKKGIFVISKIGHAFIKERMRKEDAIFAGETSAHYYFRDNFYCDNGLIPFFLIWELISREKKTLGELIEPLRNKYFVSEELNFKVGNSQKLLQTFKEKFADGKMETIDGLSIAYPLWRFNIRASNTEPVVRLNVEAKSKELLDEKTKEVLGLISKY